MATTFDPPAADAMIRQPRHVSRSFRRSAQSFGLLTALFLVWVTFGIGGEWLSNAVDDLGELVAALVAAVACAVASRRADGTRVGWLLMALSSLSWACGELIWCYYDLVQGIELPSPSAADLGFLAAVPLAVVGLRNLFPQPAGVAITRVGGVLLGMLLASGALVVVWAFTLLQEAEGRDLLQRLVGLAYPVGDLFMAAVVLSAVRRGTGDRTTMHLVMAGIVAFTVADTWFAMVVMVGDFDLGYSLDTGWVLGYFLIALGALWASHDTAPATQTWGVAPKKSRATYPPRGAPAVRAVARSQRDSSHRSGQYWLATANADHLVNYAAILLMVVDASVVLYDLGSILKMLA